VRSRPALAFLLLVLAGLMLAPAAQAVNEIAYECDLDICLLDPANPGAVTNLTFNGATSYDEKPIWSPDGSKVAFVSDFTNAGHGEKNVFVMQATAGGQEVNLATRITSYTTGSKQVADLAWSPDGSRIAYTRGNNAGDDSVWVVNADGTTTFPLEIGGGGAKRHPTWSPDSSKIAYAVVKNEPEQIYVAPSTGGFGVALANGIGHEPTWSPTGSRIAFDGYQGGKNFGYVDLHVVAPDGSGTPLVVTPSAFTEWTFNAWSPDGGRIAYRATNSEGATLYRVMNADGSGDHPLASPGAGDARSASWSPDGSRVVYEGALIGNIGARNLYITNADGSGGAMPLTSDGKSRAPAWRVVTATLQAPPPHPGAEKPKVVWITKRIFWSPGRPVYVASYFCGAPSCSVSTDGKAKGSIAAGIRFRPATANVLAKPKGKKRPKWVAVGKGKTNIPGGATSQLALHLNKLGAAIIKQRGKATIQVTIKATIQGQPKPVTESHTIHVVLKKSKKPKK
jgi:Tol biopolymer transport system component